MKHKENIDLVLQTVANDMTCELINDILNYYNCTFDDVDRLFRKMDYWKVINDDKVMCVMAHDYNFERFRKDLERIGAINELISRDNL